MSIRIDDHTLKRFLEEDIGSADITSMILREDLEADAYIICKEHAVVAGIEEASRVFALMDASIIYSISDGSMVEPNAIIMHVHGNARGILASERTVLNILMRMSGIATYTRRLIETARKVNPRVMVASTRKTAPGLRLLDKKAVAIAGGYTHRLGLYDMVLIKDNHIALVGSVRDAVRLAKSMHGSRYSIEVEVNTLEQAVEAIEEGADIVMLDNLDVSKARDIIEALSAKGFRDRVKIELSGRIDESNIAEYARLDADIISVGRITHSVKAVDMSLEVKTR